ncbi:LolA family protein [Naasia lichenicola]|uniref:Outer membrane lipoprotein carrier protein LolA n=1 Tax=Naasia lichenicola TaxID=2565933 RepID=A0A4S4FSW1_9MICO|nr:outer membrane lipoprotein carrier protein LolA [Naasia lichenicola]THG33504.1 outer membrane lipoprotein carrier protein LolA [Naasia lichenicola]
MADRSLRRWLPAIVAPIVVIGGALAVPLTAGAAGVPPEKSAQEVLELVGSNEVTALSGTVVQTSELGLPDLSGALSGTGTGGDSASSALELLTGSHTARVYLDEAQGARVQILDSMAERDIIAGPDGVWFYDSSEDTATHLALPDDPTGSAGTDGSQSDATDTVPTPAALAEHFLDAIEPSTAVSVDNTSVVAGRSAYDLVLTPDSADTLIAAVTIAVDSETGLPLSVAVTAKGQSAAAFSVAFSDISFDTPDASLFSFTPPAGATVDEQLPHAYSLSTSANGEHDSHLGDLAKNVTVTGDAWASIVELPVGDLAAGASEESADPSGSASSLLDAATEKVDGGRVLSTSLLNVLLTDDGRILAGSVPVALLQAAAAD